MAAPVQQVFLMAASATPLAGFVGAQVYTSAIGTTNFISRTAAQWDSEHFDTHAFHDSGSNTRLTIPAALDQYYVVVLGSVNMTNLSTGFDICIAKNGSITFDGTSAYMGDISVTSAGADGVSNQMFLQCRTPPIQVSAGDYFELMLQSNGDNNVTANLDRSSFAIYVVGSSVMGCLVKNTSDLTSQNYSSGGVIAWASEVYDTDAFHSTSSNQSRITIPSAANGRYGILKANIRLSSVSANQNVNVGINKGGTPFYIGFGQQNAQSGSSSYGWVEAETQPVLLTTGDYFEAAMFCNDSSTTVDANASSFSLEVLPVSFQGALCKINANVTGHNYSTPEDLTWNGTDVYDTTGADQHDPASNNTKIIITSGLNGKYAILQSNVYTSLVAGGNTNSIAIQKGNTNIYNGFGGRGSHNGTFNNTSLSGRTQIVQLTPADEFTCQFYIDDTSVTLEESVTSFGIRVLPELSA